MVTDADLTAAFKEYTKGSDTFTRRMAIDMGDWFGAPPWWIIQQLEVIGLLKSGSWDWFVANGGITADHIRQARLDRWPLTTSPDAAVTQPASNTAETTNRAVRLPAEHREPFDYYALIRRIRKSTGRL